MSDKLAGVIPALVTPMTADRQLDLRTLSHHIDWLLDAGVHGVIPLGSTGEFYALAAEERTAVLKTTIDVVQGRAPVIAGANAGSTREVVTLSQQAEQLGADGVMLAVPYYSLPSADELVVHFEAVDKAIGVPIMLYNYPGRTGVDMQPDLIERLAELDNVRYVKESTGDAARVSEIIRRCGEKVQVFCGCDTLALESFVMGAVGWVGGVVNLLPKEHVQLFELGVHKLDILAARRLYHRLLPTLHLMEGGGKYTQLVKAGCEVLGHPVGPPRGPLQPPNAAEVAELTAVLDALKRT